MPEVLWELGEHTLGKHLVLRKYLDAWYPILGRRHPRIAFIDGFAGPGEYEGGEEGSPVIAMKAFADHTAQINAIVSYELHMLATRELVGRDLCRVWKCRVRGSSRGYVVSHYLTPSEQKFFIRIESSHRRAIEARRRSQS